MDKTAHMNYSSIYMLEYTQPDGIWKLCIGDQEGGNVFLVKEVNQSVDLRVHDGFPYQRQGTVLRLLTLCQTFGLHSRYT